MSASLVKSADARFEIEWKQPSPFFGEKLYQAIEYLGFRARYCNAISACETVEKLVAEQQKYQLFKKFFHDEWNNSRASFFKVGYYENYRRAHERIFSARSRKTVSRFERLERRF